MPSQLFNRHSGTERPLLVAHRGDQYGAPENTMAAFRQATALGADVIELDVQLSRDGVPVVIHDDTLDRTTNGSGAVRCMDWDQLVQLDAGSWFGSGFAGEGIPALGDVLAWAADCGVGLLIEIKTHPVHDPDAAELLAAFFGARQLPNCAIYSSDHVLLQDLATAVPELARGALVNERTPFLPQILRITESKLLSQSVWVLTPDTVRDAQEAGAVVCSEARYPADVRMLAGWGVDLIVSNRIPLVHLAGELRRVNEMRHHDTARL
ncbi:glycerophosphodiester phosphodiesterase [Pseudarthrobacter sp. NPDC092401]|uniref:glycerophosphodiester phosphodiesterase n=2 Tax=unclassified Pseudarthrobacter TaxID=2647000 RepID=UPI00381752B5